jgi:hypothetical protein
MRKFLPVCLLFAICCAVAQDSTLSFNGFPQENGSPARRLVASGIMAGIIGTSVVWSVDAWWQGRSHPFNFYNEGWFNDYSLGVDKVGHAFASYFYFHTFHNVMLWGGFEPDAAFWWGAGITEFLALSLEVGDGFSTFGFSYEDLTANTVGLAYGMLQTQVPFFQNFSLKWSYIPTGVRDGLNFTQHYDAHTYWLSVNVHELLPAQWAEYWPRFVQLAAGYSIDGLRREGVIGLDFNLEVFPAPNPDILLLQKTFNMFHIPAPAVKFTESKEPQYYLFHLN